MGIDILYKLPELFNRMDQMIRNLPNLVIYEEFRRIPLFTSSIDSAEYSLQYNNSHISIYSSRLSSPICHIRGRGYYKSASEYVLNEYVYFNSNEELSIFNNYTNVISNIFDLTEEELFFCGIKCDIGYSMELKNIISDKSFWDKFKVERFPKIHVYVSLKNFVEMQEIVDMYVTSTGEYKNE